ncbi:Dinitrogenase iron-molybdenum cofactor biosynthesis protein [Methanococcus aeolicus Nankai-3]|uniref:Dinitrogenase iron-molybdenum cofactor biosynthesis protein n=1 Tax=Methanococcus aeolicus (strain ATCC BAA-1280 / DSM 17508 / OCM 812 / Nankai-3) TaxID=419665 RepID=A6UVB0_META3|nr:NifB/NifX family molybdenum-iron cluster-binding protein [Methanococcus aeolicus]ABR56432.1 Dinitrogenase iron-molybdenum cofactor biosynthesis protein [Methanococcus aeolicus Nankai-3]
MKIAIPMESDKICSHFGKSPYFLIAEIDDDKKEIVNTQIIDNVPCDGQGHGKAINILLNEKPDAILYINMGNNSIENLSKKSIELYKCETEEIDKNIKLYLEGKLEKIQN